MGRRRALLHTGLCLCVLGAAALAPDALTAQTRYMRFDVETLYLTVSRVWPVSDELAVGPELGGGVLEQKTFVPRGDDFTSIAHVGIVLSHQPGPSGTLELAARVGIGDLRGQSGDIPELHGGLTGTALLGSGVFRFGTRLSTSWLITGRPAAFIVTWSPVVVRIAL